MQNDQGQVVDLYVPRKCSATNRLIIAKDHASVQINIGEVNEEGKLTGSNVTYAFCGGVRETGNSDDALNRLATADGHEPARQQTTWEKFSHKFKEEPLVPIGILATVVALGGATSALQKGNRTQFNKFLRYRVAAQGVTVVAALGIDSPRSTVYIRHARRPAPLAPPPPFPSLEQAQSTLPSQLPVLFHQLALASSYSIKTPNASKLLRAAIYAFAFSPQHSSLFFGDDAAPPPVTDTFTLSDALSPSYSSSKPSEVCGHIFKAGESVYRCRDCALDPTCVLCTRCYHGSRHQKEGHDITLSVHSGMGAGCCDCGDLEAFKDGLGGGCKYHDPDVVGARGGEEDARMRSAKDDAKTMLRYLLDWVIAVLEQAPDEFLPPKSVDDIMASLPTQPPSFTPSPPPPATDSPDSTTTPTFPPSYTSSTSRGKARATTPDDDPPPAGPWSVLLWNDEKHSFSSVINQVIRATGATHASASAVAHRVDTHGRDCIYISSDPSQLIIVARVIAEIDLAVTVRSSLETFFEAVAGEVVGVLRDLSGAKVGFGGVVAEVLLERDDAEDGVSRFQRLVGVDERLWKEARKGLAELYVLLIGADKDIRNELGVHFAQIYPHVAESYLLTDREPENSIIFLGVQLFTVPSLSTYLVQSQHFLSGIISILYSFFTEQLDTTTRRHLVLPPNPTISAIDPESAFFKQKRYFQVFSDLGHLISSSGVKRLICSSPPYINDFAAFLDLFTSMNPNKRQLATHVEYESDTWVTAFNVTIQLGKIARVFGEAYQEATTNELAHALRDLMARLPGPRANVHTVIFGGAPYQLIDFVVESEPVSFHHPLAWLFAEMCKNVEKLDVEALNSIRLSSLSDIVVGAHPGGQTHFLAALDHPLRVIVLVAQIRAGLWVRNGFGIRAQQLHYKEYSLRENTYDQDVFFLQTALVVLDPSTIFIAILDRFQLLEWLGGEDQHAAYDLGQAFAVVEEMLYLLIILLSDTTYAASKTNEEILRSELVHCLALGASPYSDLMRRVSEKYADDPALDRILREVATFKQPVGINDQGTYSLKPECFEEVNPYFSRYTRNQREEADKIVREHLRKKTGEKEPVIVPAKLAIEKGPFVILRHAFTSDVLHQIIFFALQHGRQRGELFSEVLVDEALHLAMLTLLEEPALFASFAAERILSTETEESTLVRLLVKIEEDDKMKTVRHKVKWVLDRLGELVGPSVKALRKVEDEASPAKELDAKRLAAKARQAAIMAQFAKAQNAFLESSENIDDEDEDEMEESKPSLGSCIVCQDELDGSQPFGSLAFIQSSNFVRLTPTTNNADFQSEVLASPASLDRDCSHLRPFGIASKKIPTNPDDETGDGISQGFPLVNQSGLHASACGHMMHLGCFETYLKSLEQRHMTQPTRNHPENIGRKEYICPLCKSLGNVLLPATVKDLTHPVASLDERNLDEWAQLVADPLAHAAARGVHSFEAEAVIQQTLSLQHRLASGVGLTAWDFNAKLNRRFPDEFAEGDGMMMAKLLRILGPLWREMSSKTAFIPGQLVAYTISAIEIAARGSDEAAGNLPEATLRMLQSLFAILPMLVQIQASASLERAKDVAAISVIPHLGGAFAPDSRTQNLSDVDPLTTLVEAGAVMPESIDQVAAFGFYTELVKTFFAVHSLLENSGTVVPFQGDAADEALDDYRSLAQIRHFFVAPASEGLNSPEGELTLGKHLYSYVLPFLRRASIIRTVICGPSAAVDPDADGSELSRLLSSLRIPHPSIALRRDITPLPVGVSSIQTHLLACAGTIPGWKQNLLNPAPSTIDIETGLPLFIPESVLSLNAPLQHPAIYELVGLPAQLATLAAESLQRECERCKTVPAEPALCLLCGQIVCHQSFCCMDAQEEAQHGECNMHMWTCGGTCGVYFLIKRNVVLYLYTDKGTFTSPPYLDSHGEVDLVGRRGRNQFPQFLHAGRYDEIRKTWLAHGIPTFVARKMEATTDHGGWGTM
ncbi:hypothetical protein MNV49_005746 [Pseudohyphozyma bogoriensis]|nr:hypothetical protein MNV49_005746 [Pseudohyphozyma bogoriensis]